MSLVNLYYKPHSNITETNIQCGFIFLCLPVDWQAIAAVLVSLCLFVSFWKNVCRSYYGLILNVPFISPWVRMNQRCMFLSFQSVTATDLICFTWCNTQRQVFLRRTTKSTCDAYFSSSLSLWLKMTGSHNRCYNISRLWKHKVGRNVLFADPATTIYSLLWQMWLSSDVTEWGGLFTLGYCTNTQLHTFSWVVDEWYPFFSLPIIQCSFP